MQMGLKRSCLFAAVGGRPGFRICRHCWSNWWRQESRSKGSVLPNLSCSSPVRKMVWFVCGFCRCRRCKVPSGWLQVWLLGNRSSVQLHDGTAGIILLTADGGSVLIVFLVNKNSESLGTVWEQFWFGLVSWFDSKRDDTVNAVLIKYRIKRIVHKD